MKINAECFLTMIFGVAKHCNKLCHTQNYTDADILLSYHSLNSLLFCRK